MSSDNVPEHVTPHNLLDLTNDQIDILLDGIRTRRMLSLAVYHDSLAEKEKRQATRAKVALEKKLAIFKKEYARMDALLEKLEKRANEIRALSLQAELADED